MGPFSFKIPDEKDPMFRAYRRSVWESDALEQGPVHAGRNILILPRDNRCIETEGRTVLYMDSRYAFGDGRHPTTILCLTLLEEYLEELDPSEKKGLCMLDMGTGTGILAILAASMGLSNILAIDIDPESIASARELAVLNRCPSIEFREMDASLLPGIPAYGLITTNLLPHVLRIIIPLAAGLSLPGAPVIVSGIGDASRYEMESLMKRSGFTDLKRLSAGWWHAYLMRR